MHQLQKKVDARVVILGGSVLLVDQITKFAAWRLLPDDGIILIPNVAALTRFENAGALASAPVLNALLVLAGFVVVLLLLRRAQFWNRTGLALVLGAGASNLLDRIVQGAVRDPLLLFNLSAINLADIMIGIGVILLITRSGRGADSSYG